MRFFRQTKSQRFASAKLQSFLELAKNIFPCVQNIYYLCNYYKCNNYKCNKL